jgi:hypothetical protein
MTQADSVHSTPRITASKINPPVDPTRRHLLTVAAAGAVAAAIPAAVLAAKTLDAELIELGTRFEPLVDRYYVTHRRWSRLLAQAHADQEAEFGPPAERNYQDTPEISAAWSERCVRVDGADDGLSALYAEMKQLANAINAASVNSIECLRAKASVAFWEVAPLCAGDTEFSFEDAYPFQQLFTAVAEFCGLNDDGLRIAGRRRGRRRLR